MHRKRKIAAYANKQTVEEGLKDIKDEKVT